jgi:hypothetical protein
MSEGDGVTVSEFARRRAMAPMSRARSLRKVCLDLGQAGADTSVLGRVTASLVSEHAQS